MYIFRGCAPPEYPPVGYVVIEDGWRRKKTIYYALYMNLFTWPAIVDSMTFYGIIKMERNIIGSLDVLLPDPGHPGIARTWGKSDQWWQWSVFGAISVKIRDSSIHNGERFEPKT